MAKTQILRGQYRQSEQGVMEREHQAMYSFSITLTRSLRKKGTFSGVIVKIVSVYLLKRSLLKRKEFAPLNTPFQKRIDVLESKTETHNNCVYCKQWQTKQP